MDHNRLSRIKQEMSTKALKMRKDHKKIDINFKNQYII